jgi:8-oxo-dGTP diphosphatase
MPPEHPAGRKVAGRIPNGAECSGATVLVAVGAAIEEACSAVSEPSLPLPVVAAVIERGGCVLLAQRPAHKHLARKWEFPGGKVEPGEAAEAALVREIREELGCEIRMVRALPRFTHVYDPVTIEMISFVCCLAPGSPEPHPAEHLAIAWVQPAALAGYDLAPADLPVAAAIQGPEATTAAGSCVPGVASPLCEATGLRPGTPTSEPAPRPSEQE